MQRQLHKDWREAEIYRLPSMMALGIGPDDDDEDEEDKPKGPPHDK